MTNKFLHIGMVYPTNQKISDLDGFFNEIGDDWVRYAPNNWIVWTNRSASSWFALLKPTLATTDQILISELNLEERAGLLTPVIWDWIDKKRAGGMETVSGLLGNYLAPSSGAFGALGGLINNPLFGDDRKSRK